MRESASGAREKERVSEKAHKTEPAHLPYLAAYRN